jgi:magnesium-transporting ATPase (P-type)
MGSHLRASRHDDRSNAFDEAAELIKKDMLSGAMAIEGKLQDVAPDMIHTLQMAYINVF